MSLPSLLYTDVEDDLRSAVRKALDDLAPWSEVLAGLDQERKVPHGMWRVLTDDLGLVGLPVAEELGGAGATWREVSVVMEELGRAVADVPFLSSSVASTALAQSACADDVLEQLAGGAVGAVAIPFTQPLDAPVEGLVLEQGLLSGTVPAVIGATEADFLLVVVGQELVLVQAEACTMRPETSLDETRPVATVIFDRTSARVVGPVDEDQLERAASIAASMLAAEQLGVAERCLEMTVEYLKTRRQFGRVLGSYQALKHRLADLWTEITQTRAVVRYAAACAAEGSEDLAVAASLAQAVASSTAQRTAEAAVQLHGGIGFTWEHPVHLLLKRARADALAFGTPGHHRHRLAGLVDLPAPTAEARA